MGPSDLIEDSVRFVRWLEQEVVADARGDRIRASKTMPAARFWLGRLAPEDAASESGRHARLRRLDPCSMGFTFRPGDWDWSIEVGFCVWEADHGTTPPTWRKSDRLSVEVRPEGVDRNFRGRLRFGAREFASAFAERGIHDRSARIDFELEHDPDGIQVTVLVVNDTSTKDGAFDPNMYEVELRMRTGRVRSFLLDALPDSFRYDRRIAAYGVNAGVEYDGTWMKTTDCVRADRQRPGYWDDDIGAQPDLDFSTLARRPLPSLKRLVDAMRRWGDKHWSPERLAERAARDGWTAEMQEAARIEAERFVSEVRRVRAGLELLESDERVMLAFKLMNESFVHSGRKGGYTGWRPFQVGFLLGVLSSLVSDADPRRRVVDTLWFPTGGGKTETYLAAVVFSCLWDRIRGKAHGVTAWSRFPLRMLSLQQTQRFADALAGAELARQRAGLGGEPFALGFYVGGPPNGTPNRIRDDASGNDTDTSDLNPHSHRVLLHCPFCFSTDIAMHFDRRTWRLEHRCTARSCPWTKTRGLPFYIVDEEIYRFLPSVVIGTLDKAASVAFQAAQRGLYAAPLGRCSREGHGFTYAQRGNSPTGCQVPGCRAPRERLGQPAELFAPTLRVQDELHLLRDSLGAVDSHYETLLDHLQRRTTGRGAKIIASSATLEGHDHQVRVLYDREGDVFPLPGPEHGVSFWTRDTPLLARRYVGLAPRGHTLEFANDRLAESLQRAVRRLLTEPNAVCLEARISRAHVESLLSLYGTHVCYGTKLTDVDAAVRSFETQPGVEPLNVSRLTGDTELEEVRQVLARLAAPEDRFDDRIHVVCASSMMSHGVDVDRFNVMTILGLPLATAEFIQASARIGRRYPGIVFVLHRVAVERDASVFRSFRPYVEQGDRFVEPVPITRRSRRVLGCTFPGLFAARVFAVHEPRWLGRTRRSLTTARELRRYVASAPLHEEDEFRELCDALGLRPGEGSPLELELEREYRRTFSELRNPASRAKMVHELLPAPPMRSLREVETQIRIFSRERS